MFIDNFVPSIDEKELKEGTMKMVQVAGRDILLARIGDAVYGISHICPCMQCDLAQGKLEGYIVICPCHGWRFDVRTGIYLTGGGALLRGLSKRIANKTKLDVHVADDPLRAVVRGTSLAIQNVGKYSFMIDRKSI